MHLGCQFLFAPLTHTYYLAETLKNELEEFVRLKKCPSGSGRGWKMKRGSKETKSKRWRCCWPCLQVHDGVLHPPLVVFAHVLVHVWVVGADVLLRAPVGHRAELEGWVLLLGMLKLVAHTEAGQAPICLTHFCPLPWLTGDWVRVKINQSIIQINDSRPVDFKWLFFIVFKNSGNWVTLNEIRFFFFHSTPNSCALINLPFKCMGFGSR